MAAGAVYSGPFENEWLITKPDTMAPELKERRHRIARWHEYMRAGWKPSKWRTKEEYVAEPNDVWLFDEWLRFYFDSALRDIERHHAARFAMFAAR